MLKKIYKQVIRKFPYVKELYEEYHDNHIVMPFPAGHYYSPVNNFKYLEENRHSIFKMNNTPIGVDLNIDNQNILLQELNQYCKSFSLPNKKEEGYRFFMQNNFYTSSDAVFLYAMLLHLRPGKIIEVGSGFSSALMLDVNDKFLNKSVELNFIEPYPERLYSLIKKHDNSHVFESFVQQVDVSLFQSLKKNDILFIDSSHVLKTGSDLSFLLFKVLPILNSGVYIHFHDIFYPFEYPEDWVLKDKLSWNENYALHSFLMYNNEFSIQLFNTYLHQQFTNWFVENMPVFVNNNFPTIPGSIWLKKA